MAGGVELLVFDEIAYWEVLKMLMESMGGHKTRNPKSEPEKPEPEPKKPKLKKPDHYFE